MKRSFSIPTILQSFILFKIVRLMEDAKEILANMSTLLTIHINCSWQMSLWMTKGYIGKFSVSSKYSKKSNLFQNSPKGPFGAFRWGATAPLKYFSSGLTSAHLPCLRAPSEPMNYQVTCSFANCMTTIGGVTHFDMDWHLACQDLSKKV